MTLMEPPCDLGVDGSFSGIGELFERLHGQDAAEVNRGVGLDFERCIHTLDVFWERVAVLSSFDLVKTL